MEQIENPDSPIEQEARKWNRIRRLLGHVFPSIDPIVEKHSEMDDSGSYWVNIRTRQSGRVTYHVPSYMMGVLIVPSAEFIDQDFGDLTEEDKQRLLAQCEMPHAPVVEPESTKS